ncbi:hypothetical protein B0H16DRAFT_1479091 [Mycena metata]|uniref:Uncharacterized protein n=1 Tax=Mycena metata TaxID=1033252 RepID=A0AAD7H620_9AGAR|nr:hypothetical protein B0H16DRAFT_1479091 [Mycena metata]
MARNVKDVKYTNGAIGAYAPSAIGPLMVVAYIKDGWTSAVIHPPPPPPPPPPYHHPHLNGKLYSCVQPYRNTLKCTSLQRLVHRVKPALPVVYRLGKVGGAFPVQRLGRRTLKVDKLFKEVFNVLDAVEPLAYMMTSDDYTSSSPRADGIIFTTTESCTNQLFGDDFISACKLQ